MSTDSDPTQHEGCGNHSADPRRFGGLAPADALAWLELQSRHAFEPECFAPRLKAGAAAESLFGSADPMPPFAERTRDSTGDGAAAQARATRLASLGVRIVPLPHTDYPESLRALEDAPLVLTVRGRADRLGGPAIAIVGARAATRAAREIARRLAFDLARAGLTIVSGLARGIDGAAHRGALDAGGATIGVLACGIDRIYPPEHRRLADAMVEAGAIVSELPPGTLPRPLHFPLRNRIISGLVRGVIVVEARERSGSLITVRHALAQGREVFVVPGAVDGPYATGTNQLLREGARAVRSANDVLEDLGIGSAYGSARKHDPESLRDPRAPEATKNAGQAGIEARIRRLLADGPRTRDALLRDSGLAPGGLATILLELELAGHVVEERDGRIHLVRSPASHRSGVLR